MISSKLRAVGRMILVNGKMGTCESGSQRFCNLFPIFGFLWSCITFLHGWFWIPVEESSGKWARNRLVFGPNAYWIRRWRELYFPLDVLTETVLHAIHFAIFFLVGQSIESHRLVSRGVGVYQMRKNRKWLSDVPIWYPIERSDSPNYQVRLISLDSFALKKQKRGKNEKRIK